MSPPAPGRPTARLCTECQRPLSALRAMRWAVCEQPDCLQRSELRRTRAARNRVDAGLRQGLSDRLGAERAAALQVLWITPHQSALADLPAELSEQVRAHLLGLAATEGAAGTQPADPAPQAGPVSAAEWGLCGWCGGRCCQFGGPENGYIRLPHLRRWQHDHPGSTLQDAAQAYIDRLHPRHVASSCAFHGPQGCTLDRPMRSEVCNQFACDGLRDVQRYLETNAAADRPAPEWLFVQGHRAEPVATRLQLSPAADPE